MVGPFGIQVVPESVDVYIWLALKPSSASPPATSLLPSAEEATQVHPSVGPLGVHVAPEFVDV